MKQVYINLYNFFSFTWAILSFVKIYTKSGHNKHLDTVIIFSKECGASGLTDI